MSFGTTFISHDHGRTFQVSDGDTFIDEVKPPQALSVEFELIDPDINAHITFNRDIDFDVDPAWFVMLYRGTNDGLYEGTSVASVNGHTLTVVGTASSHDLPDIGHDKVMYRTDDLLSIIGDGSVGLLQGSNGVLVPSFTVEESNDYSSPISSVVSEVDPDILITLTFNKQLNQGISANKLNFSIRYNNYTYVVVSSEFTEYTLIVVATKTASDVGANRLIYVKSFDGFLTGINGVEIRGFTITI